MSGVGSTNAMKKGSANNPFLAFSEADMKGYLNSAYTGCIVKYNGDPIARKITFETANVPEHAQNLVFTRNAPTFGDYGFGDLVITKKQNGSTTTEYLRCAYCNLLTGLIGPLSSGTPSGDNYVKFIGLFSSNINTSNSNLIRACWVPDAIDSKYEYPDWWPVTPGWQEDFVNTEGKVVEWGYGEDVVFTYSGDSDAVLLVPCVITPYEVGELYKVVYSNNEYRYEEFHCISEDKTTAGVEDVAPGKTFYDFTGTKQIGTGTRANPFLARSDADMNAFNNATYLGKFVKYIGKTNDTYVKDAIYQVTNDATEYDRYMLLPTLENEGKASDLAQGKQLINSQGEVVVGTRSGDIDYTQDYMFWDYDGTLVASYSYDELQSLESLPEGPNHTAQGLRFMSWGVDLSTLKSSISKSADICAKYKIIDGKTHIFIDSSYLLNGVMYLYLYKQANSSPYDIDVTVDWGDGTVEDLYYNTHHAIQHTYLDATKKYEITIKNKNSRYGYNMFYYKNYNCCNVNVSYSEVNNANKMYNSDIKISSSLAIIGMYVSNINSWDTYSIYSNFAFCKNLKFVVFEYLNFANLPAYGLFNTGLKFYSCYSVTSPDALYKSNVQILAINKPDSSSVRSSLDISIAPSSRLPLKRLCISHMLSTPSSTQGIDGNSYDICKVALPSNHLLVFKSYTNVSLESAMYGYQSQPESIATYSCIKKFYFLDKSSKYTTLPAASFQGSHINELHMQWSTPPTLTEWFTNFVVDKIFVPTASLDAYKAATGWSDVADKIFAEEA